MVRAALTLVCSLALSAVPAFGDDKPEGFTILFNGKDLTNWQGVIPISKRAKMSPEEREKAQATANEKMEAHWKVVDGILTYDGKGDSLQSIKDYGDI